MKALTTLRRAFIDYTKEKGRLYVTGNIYATGTITSAGAISYTTLTTTGAAVIGTNLTVTAGTILNSLGGLTLTNGNILVTQGNLTLTLGNAILTAGNLTLTLGNLLLTNGTTTLGGTTTVSTGNLVVTTGNITASAGNIVSTLGSVTAGTTVTAGTGLTVTTGDSTFSGAATSPVKVLGANGQYLAIRQATTLLDMATAPGTGTGTITATNLIPANSLVLGITARVHPILAGAGLTTWSLGVTGHTTYYGTTLLIADTTTVGIADYTETYPRFYAGATHVLMTAAAGVFSTGGCRITVHYINLTPATS